MWTDPHTLMLGCVSSELWSKPYPRATRPVAGGYLAEALVTPVDGRPGNAW